MKKIITLICFLCISLSYGQLVAIDDVLVARSDNPNAAPSTGDRIFLNDYFNGSPITFANYNDFTLTETVADPFGYITFNPLGFVTVAANTPQGIYYVTYQICEDANPTNCDTAVIEIRVFPGSISSGSGSSEMTISASSGSVSCSGNVCITDDFCLDRNTGTIPPLTLSATYQEIGESDGYVVNTIPFNPPFSFGDTSTGVSLTTDDNWSNVINFAFDFEFYEQNYTSCVLSTNGAVSFDLSNAGDTHYWTPAAGALIPNNTDAALRDGNIFGAIHDTDPSASGTLGTDYNITYSIKGEAPFRVFVFSFFNVAQFSCNELKTSQMIMFYETTNIIETYIFQKPICPGWAGGRAAIGIQNNAGTEGLAPPGRNTEVWDVPFLAPEAYQFVPAGDTITSFEWLAEDGSVLGTDPTALVVTPSVTTTYVAQVTYTDAISGEEFIAYRPITVVVAPTPAVTITAGADLCDSGDAVFTIEGSENDVVEYNVNGGATQTLTLDATGQEVITLTGVTTTQTINLLSANNLNSTCGGAVSLSATITVNDSPVVDDPVDVFACNEYFLPALTSGTYYTETGGPGGTGVTMAAGDQILTTQDVYVYDETGTTPNCFDENMFTVTINSCTLAVSASADTPAICSDATADVTLTATPSPAIPVGNYTYSWTLQGDATVLGTNQTLVLSPPPTATTTYEVTLVDDGLTAPNDSVTNTVTVTVNPVANPTFTTTATCDGGTATVTGDAGGTFSFTPAPTDGAVIDSVSGTVTGGTPGTTYNVTYTISGTCGASSAESITVLPADSADFTMIPTCDGATANVTGTAGGTFTFNPAPTDGAIIDNVLGTVTGGTSGTSYTVEYTTAGVCPDTSQQTFSVLTTAITTFTTTPTCDGGTVTVTGDAGGSFAFNPAPTDGAVIDTVSGTITGGTSGETYNIEYTIGGACGSSTIESVTVLPQEDASFTVLENCEGGTMNILGDANGTFTFNPLPTDGATINATTGAVTNGTPGTTYTVQYTTSGPCTATSFQNVTVLSADDASFTVTETCDGATATVLGTIGGTFALNPLPTDGAVIDSANGTVTGGTAGASYTIEYTTSGACPEVETLAFNVLPADNPAFTIAPTCDGATVTVTGDLGGTFAFNPAPADGAIIDVVTGTISGGTPGDSYIIEYTTPGPCVVSLAQSFTANPLPTVIDPTPLVSCDDNIPDGMTEMDLTTKSSEITGNNPNYIVTYYNSSAEAAAGTPQVTPSANAYVGTDGETIHVRVEDATTGCYDLTTLTLNVVSAPAANTPSDLHYCDPDNDGLGTFDLSNVAAEVTTDPALEVTFHLTYQNAVDDVLPQGNTLSNVAGQIIYIRVDYAGVTTDCPTIVELQLIVDETPEIELNPDPIVLCDDAVADGLTEFDLNVRDLQILDGLNAADYTVTYYGDPADADLGPTAPSYIASPGAYTNTIPDLHTVGVRVENNTTGCFTVATLDLIVNPLPVPETTNDALFLTICDDSIDNDGYAVFDLTVQDALITGGNTNWSVSYFETAADVPANPIPDFTAYTNVSIGGLPHNPQTLIVLVSNGTTGCTNTSTLTIEVSNVPTPTPSANITPLVECDDDNNGYAVFDLQSATTEIDNGEGNDISYHGTYDNAFDDVNELPDFYENNDANTDIVYVRAENPTTGCFTIVELILNVLPTPEVPLNIDVYSECDDNDDGVTTFNLTTMDAVIYGTQNPADYTLTYHESLANAEATPGINPIVEPQLSNYVSANTTIYVRLEGANGCIATGQFDLLVSLPPVIASEDGLFEICDDTIANDGFASFDLTTQNDIITGSDATLTVDYYETMADVNAGTPIPDYTDYTNVSIGGLPHNPQTIFVTVIETSSGNSCYSVTTLTLVVNTLPTPNDNLPDLELCDDNAPGDLQEAFDLTSNEAAMLNAFDETVTYHTTISDAELGNNPIVDPTAYVNESPTQTIYVRVTKTGDPSNPADLGTGCSTVVTFDIIVNPLPDTPVAVEDIIGCDDPFDGVYTFDLTQREIEILDGQSDIDFNVTYYTTLAAAEAGAGEIANPSAFTNTVNPQEIFVNIANTTTGCDIATVSFFVIVQEAAVANPDNNPLEFALCDDNMEFDGNPTNDTVGFDLGSQDGFVLDGQNATNFTVSYYETQADADLGTNAIDTSSPYVNTVNPQVIYVRVDNDTTVDDICFDTTTMTLLVDPIPAFTLEDSYTLCVNTNGTEVVGSPIMDTQLDPTLYTFEWTEASDPTTVIGTGASYEATAAGTYTVLVTDANNLCPSLLTTEVVLSSPPVLVAEVTTQAFADNHVIVATATGDGSAEFEFSIDNGPWLSNDPNNNTYTFTNVSIGEHTIRTRDINGCGEAVDEVLVLDYPLFFTPNNDGDNDTWQITGVTSLSNVTLYIFDRYGKLLKQLNPNGPGWDGTLNGQPLPSSDYWFSLDYKEAPNEEMKQFKAHFTLKR
ncbi:T9SS type B sorting domain-containing protein [Bizionia sp. KMM 8389]